MNSDHLSDESRLSKIMHLLVKHVIYVFKSEIHVMAIIVHDTKCCDPSFSCNPGLLAV